MKTEEKKDVTLSEAERMVITRCATAKALVEQFLAENHAAKVQEQFTAVVRVVNIDVISGLAAVHRLERLSPPKQARSNRYVN